MGIVWTIFLYLGGALILTEILSQRAVKPKTTNHLPKVEKFEDATSGIEAVELVGWLFLV